LKIEPIGTVRKISGEESMIEVFPAYREGLYGITAGDRLDVLYWMHKLDPEGRKVLKVHPRGDGSRPLEGVFGLRSPMRPNPIGVSTVCVKRIEQDGLLVSALDAEDGSPVIDLKASRKCPR
jgi:tRNA-Thr(GGU) m(6)t(6)A37 methyltransferase TsaA